MGGRAGRASPRALPLRFEPLEDRRLLAGRIDLGPSENLALDQPRVAVELFADPLGTQSLGPQVFNTFLLDTGANSIMAMASAVGEMSQPPSPGYVTQGRFVESGVAGQQYLDISVPYRFDFAGTNGDRNVLLNTRILSDATSDFSMFGPWGIVGMPAMVGRVTSFDFTNWSNGGTGKPDDIYMHVAFGNALAPGQGHRYSFPVDTRIHIDPQDQVLSGDPPVYADVPMLTAVPVHQGQARPGNFLFDTGAQMSLISSRLAFALGLDANHDGSLNDEAVRFETVGGLGGEVTVPVLAIDELHLPTDQGVDLVWSNLEWLVEDIPTPQGQPTLDGVFGSDLLTSGWVNAFLLGGPDGYIDQVQLDFRNMANGSGTIYFDLNPAVDQVVSDGPGVRVTPTSGLVTTEAGTSATFNVVLNAKPAADVLIPLASSDTTEGTVAPASLLFTPDNWNQPQTVTVTGVADQIADGSVNYTILVGPVTSADPAYNGLDPTDVSVTNVDVTSLGTIESLTLPRQDLLGPQVWYRFQNAHPGQLTIEGRSTFGADGAQLTLYDAGMHELAFSSLVGGNPRIDQNVATAGNTYFLRLTGVALDLELRFANPNPPPTLDPIANPAAIPENAGTQTINLTGISAGAGETQALRVTATSGNVGLIPNPTVSYTSPNSTASLSYAPLANQTGSAGITVEVRDAGLDGLFDTADDGVFRRSFTATVYPLSHLLGRYVFYNNSKFDANDPAANAPDDAAIALDKKPLLPGTMATFANYTSYSRGINGIMVDIAGLPATTLAATDFTFKYGNDDTPGKWLAAANPTTIAVRPGAGTGGSDRITLVWADNAIPNGNWLQVTVLASARTGLPADDVFYFGSAIGETGNTPGPTPPADAKVNSSDVTLIRNNYSGFGTVGIDSVYDINRDGKVSSSDVTITRNYYSGFTPLVLITPPAPLAGAWTSPAAVPLLAAGTTIVGDSRPALGALALAKAAALDAVLRRSFDRWEAQDYADLAWSWQVERAGARPKASASGFGTQDPLDQMLAAYRDVILRMA